MDMDYGRSHRRPPPEASVPKGYRAVVRAGSPPRVGDDLSTRPTLTHNSV